MTDIGRSPLLVLTPEEAADLLKIGRTKIYALIQRGELRSIRIDKSRRIPYAALEAFVEAKLDAAGTDDPL